jgi:hypothetical protein
VSAWELLEESLPVSVGLTRAEIRVVQEALASIMKRQLSEGSIWPVLERTLNEEIKPIKGLTPAELRVIQSTSPGRNINVKSGISGKVGVLPAASWSIIQKEIESNPDYYEWMLRGEGTIQDLIQKIAGSTGQAPAPTAPKASVPSIIPNKVSAGPGTEYKGLPGKTAPVGKINLTQAPAVPPPAPTAGGNGSPFSSRAAKVKQQDIAGMQGSTLSQKQTGNMLSPDADKGEEEDPTKWFESVSRKIHV